MLLDSSLAPDLVVPSTVGICCFVTPYADSSIIRAGNECVDFFNDLDLINPVSMVVEVCHKRDSSFHICILRLLHLIIIYMPGFDQSISARSEQVARDGILLAIVIRDCHGVDSVAVLCVVIIISEHDRQLALFGLLLAISLLTVHKESFN